MGSPDIPPDASGQRVAQIVVDEVALGAVASKVTAYVGDLEVTDADAAATGVGLTATRFLTFGGATVATVTTGSPTPSWSLLLGDGQGSAQVAMELELELDPVASGTGLEAASSAHAVTRNAYLPFGATRGGDNLATSRGWLGQVADADTGLIYLNARYYDPVLARFVSPDPLMNPGDPKTLDPYRYADNNPLMMTDASGLAGCYGLPADLELKCISYGGTGAAPTVTPPAAAQPAGRSQGSSGTGSPGGSGGGGGLPVPPFTPGPVVPQWDQLGETFFGTLTDCAGDLTERLQCALRGGGGYRDANGQLRIDSLKRYYTRPGTSEFWKSVRTWLFGPNARTAVAVGSHLDNAGPQAEAVGFALSAQDSVWHVQDLGADAAMGDTETAVYAMLRWGAGEAGGKVGQAYGTSLGLEAGAACGPQGVGVCGPIFAGIGSFVAGGLGDATATAVFDHLLGGDAYLEWRSGQTRRIGLP